jgi:hypothetical protein
MIIYIVVSIIFLLFIHFISYWFVKISELTELFKNPQCTQIQCNVKFVNDRLKDAFIWIPYLEKNIEIIEANLPQQLTVENFETFEPFENSNDCKISQPRIINQFGKIETIYRKIYDKQVKMKNMLTKFEKNIKFPAKNINENCFQIENAQECHSDTLKTKIANIYHKLDEIEYRNERTYKKIERHYKRLIEYQKKRDLAIGEVANKANDVMKNIIGVPVDLKLGNHLKAGISDNMKSNIKSAMSGDMSKLKDMINTPEIQNMLKTINPAKLMDNLAGLTPSDSKQFSDIGSKLLNDGLNNENDSDAVEAKANMGSSMKKVKIPWFIRKLIELGGEDLGDL